MNWTLFSWLAAILGALTIASVILAVAQYFVEPSVYEQKVESVLIDNVLDELAFCESSSNPRAINYNDGAQGEHSKGLLQFKEETFHHFGERYGLPHDDIWDVEQQKAIARKMLSENRWQNWYNCLKDKFKNV